MSEISRRTARAHPAILTAVLLISWFLQLVASSMLVTVESLSYAEAAGVLDVPLGTVMSRLSRGRARLAATMADGGTAAPRLRRIK